MEDKTSPDFNKGSMILADGLILATDGAKSLYLVEPDPSGFKPLASAELLAEAGTDGGGIAARIGGSTQNWAPCSRRWQAAYPRPQPDEVCQSR